MRQRFVIVAGCLALAGCSKSGISPVPPPEVSTNVAASNHHLDPCALLRSEEIESVQGQAIKDIQSSSKVGRGFLISLCYFMLPTSANSISLTLTQKSDAPDARAPKEFWRETFHRDHDSSEEGERDKPAGRGEERERKSPPEKLAGLGDEAFWMGRQVGSALYVLKEDVFIQISVGGSGDAASKLEKSKTLAQFILKRL